VKYYQKRLKFACNYFENSSASGGLRPQTPTRAPPLGPWAPLEDSRSPDPCGSPHSKPPSAAYVSNFIFSSLILSDLNKHFSDTKSI